MEQNKKLTDDFKSVNDIKLLDQEFDNLIDIIDEINHDQKSIIKISFSNEVIKEYDCTSLEDLRRLYIDRSDLIDYEFEDRIESFLYNFIDNYTLCRSMAGLIHQEYLRNNNK